MPHNKPTSKYGLCQHCDAILENSRHHCPSCGHQHIPSFDIDHSFEAHEPPEPYGIYERHDIPAEDRDGLNGIASPTEDDEVFYQNMIEQLTKFNQTHPYPPADPNCWITSSETPHTYVPPATSSAPTQTREADSRSIRSRKGKQREYSPSDLSAGHELPLPICTNPSCPVKHATHAQGLYLHNGVRLTVKDPVWWISDPPPYVRDALRRVHEGNWKEGDDDVVRRFIGIHVIEEGKRRREKKEESKEGKRRKEKKRL